MKRTFAVVLLVALLAVSLPATAFAAGQTRVYRINTKSVFVHSAANSKESSRTGYITRNTAFTVTKKAGRWYKIKTMKKVKTIKNGQTGWIYAGSGYVATGAYARVNTSKGGLNIRKTINGEPVLGSAPKGAQVTVEYISGDWAKVTYKKLKGWSYRKYLKWIA